MRGLAGFKAGMRKLFPRNLFRFFAGWLDGSGLYSFPCPCCGQGSCPVGGMGAGIVGGLFSLWAWLIQGRFNRPSNRIRRSHGARLDQVGLPVEKYSEEKEAIS
jgi:hypothetical protein